ncbi:MAG TPA: hypothetical protein VNY84_02420, partial [Acidimicrobiales bacterium]|nr:hypothetical protein [Acidimicrobiales bacterium]
MCAQLAQLEEAMAAFASSFDPAVISAAQAEGVMERAARIEHMAATVKALAAARMAATELWSLDGDRSPAHMLARRTGSNVSAAAQALEMATKLAHHAKTEAAARRGELSLAQASAVADAAEADPACEEELLALASRASLQELREESGRRVAAASDATEAHARIHAQRAVRSWTGTDGVW